MPIYEYRCQDCGKIFSHLFLTHKETIQISCKFCGSAALERLLSSFSIHQTEESRIKNFDTSKPPPPEFYKDSRNIGLWSKKRLRELGVDLGSKLDEIVEKGRSGKILDEVMK